MKMFTILQELLSEKPYTLSNGNIYGGLIIYVDGMPFGSFSNAGTALKLPVDAQKELLKIRGARFLKYHIKSKPSKDYVILPPDFVEPGSEEFKKWAERSIAFVKAASTTSHQKESPDLQADVLHS